ncbi:MAG: hypothetical protein HN353_06985 [Bdellovibrionales bacterium]|jgi:Leucine-rich repeat (LRR) protein|nr:hypothetical protein [Bdellovibrionales bacterium]MBT3525276.1 hypothetical protein [Bdellovibrionales bacterium]MBT7667966.1 hypothetical protein [Bdellovibrionales bacterium]MBT7767433.1 hypothetical protein [Bdellovibrionales bacterium]
MSDSVTRWRKKLAKNQTQLPTELFECSQLKEIDLNGAGLTAIDANISKLSNLERLTCTGASNLTTLPPELFLLPSFKHLKLKSCGLIQLPELPPQACVKLTTLQLPNNALIDLPQWIGRCQWLESMLLTGNQLTTLPETMVELSSLRRLNLDGNQFTALPEWISRLSGLNHLSLDNNPLTDVEKQRLFDLFQIWF